MESRSKERQEPQLKRPASMSGHRGLRSGSAKAMDLTAAGCLVSLKALPSHSAAISIRSIGSNNRRDRKGSQRPGAIDAEPEKAAHRLRRCVPTSATPVNSRATPQLIVGDLHENLSDFESLFMALASACRVETQLEHLGKALGGSRKARNLRLGLGRQTEFKPALRGADAVLNLQIIGEGIVHRQWVTLQTSRTDLKSQARKRLGLRVLLR